MILVNFKNYVSGVGEKAVSLAKVCAEISGDVPVVAVVGAVDLYRVKESIGDKDVWVQHLDGIGYGQNTGWILPEAIKEAGATGAFLNHSEHKFSDKEFLRTTIKRCKAVGLKTAVFAVDLGELEEVLGLGPDYVAYEPPELIGSKEHSVGDQSEIIAEAAVMTKEKGIPLLAGAGIHSPADVRSSLVSGAVGVVVARDILEAADPKQEILRLMEGFTHPGVEMMTSNSR